MQVSHLLQLITKQLHYFYANQAIYFQIVNYEISTLFLRISKSLQIKPIIIFCNDLLLCIMDTSITKYIRNNILHILKKYFKISFVPICFQHLSLTNLAFLPCLYNQFVLVKETFLCVLFKILYSYGTSIINIRTHKQQLNHRLVTTFQLIA